ncbi:MAG: hypothetical protein R3A80_02075 [Bdellovibrionota bacterium]
MRRLISFVISISIGLGPLYSSESKVSAWNKDAITHLKTLEKKGVESYLSQLEKGLGEALLVSDAQYLRKTLAKSFKASPPSFPKFSTQGSALIFKIENGAVLTLEQGSVDSDVWLLNKKALIVKDKSVEEIAHDAWDLLREEYKLGPYPEKNTKNAHNVIENIFNLFLPKAEAWVGAVIAIAVAVAVIGSVIYYVRKTTKASEKAIRQVGNSTARGIDKVSDAAANAVNRVGNSAATAVDKAGDLTDAATEAVNSHAN